jgi:hypothetical protein
MIGGANGSCGANSQGGANWTKVEPKTGGQFNTEKIREWIEKKSEVYVIDFIILDLQ